MGPRTRGEQLKEVLPLQEDFVFSPIGEPSSAHAEVLHQAQVLHLVSDENFIKSVLREHEKRET